MTKEGGRPHHARPVDRWHPVCPLCREEVDCNNDERCTNKNCDGHGMTVNQLQLWLIATSNPEK